MYITKITPSATWVCWDPDTSGLLCGRHRCPPPERARRSSRNCMPPAHCPRCTPSPALPLPPISGNLPPRDLTHVGSAASALSLPTDVNAFPSAAGPPAVLPWEAVLFVYFSVGMFALISLLCELSLQISLDLSTCRLRPPQLV